MEDKEASPLGSLDGPLISVVRRDPVSCTPETPIRRVLESMHRLAIGSMIVVGEDASPVGIITLPDVLDKVTLAGRDLDEPIARVMNIHPVRLPPDAPIFEAMMVMARHATRHVLVVDGQQLRGVVSENDLVNLFRATPRHIGSAIRKAADSDDLVRCSQDVRQVAHHMLAQGVAAQNLTRLVSTLNDVLSQRIIELEFDGIDLDGVQVCWLIMGSEGRYEQTLSTDQDNGIIFSAPASSAAEKIRDRLVPAAERVNHMLDRCGIALCKGKIMAGNRAWCLSAEEWRSKFATWIDHGDPDALLHGSIFFDFRPLYGEAGLAADLREWLASHASANPRFLHQMAANALRNRPPLGLLRDFALTRKGDEPAALDLKLNGTTPFVDAARIYSLAHGVKLTNTADRLRQAAPSLNIRAEEVEAWIEAFLFIQQLRLRGQQMKTSRGLDMDNRIEPKLLNNLDRRILKEAFLEARRLQARLALDYQV